MTPEEKMYQDLLIALVKTEKNQEASIEAQKLTTDNVNKLIVHMDELLPVHKDIHYLKKLLYVSLTIFSAYVLWSSKELSEVKSDVHSHIETQIVQYGGMKERVNKLEKGN